MGKRSRYLIVEKKTKGKTFTVTLMGTGSDLLRLVGEQVNGIEKQMRGLRIMNAQSPFAPRPARAREKTPAAAERSFEVEPVRHDGVFVFQAPIVKAT